MIFIFLFLFQINQSPWSTTLEKKIHQTVERSFDVSQFELEALKTKQKNDEHSLDNDIYVVLSNNNRLGYIYVDQADSKHDVFDYIIVIDTNLEIINTKVLVYREKHGRQIGHKRWLSQFIGLSHNDHAKLNDNIDGISGATISCNSMTVAIDNFLMALNDLNESNTFK